MSENTLRRGHIIHPFGVGAIYEFENDTLIAASLDYWHTLRCKRLKDKRLASQLGVSYFLEPPAVPRLPQSKTRQSQHPGILYLRFPQWHFCPSCRFMKKSSLQAKRAPVCSQESLLSSPTAKTKPCQQGRQEVMVPMTYLLVCPQGHVSDFPWIEWAHADKERRLNLCDDPKLYFLRSRGSNSHIIHCAHCQAENTFSVPLHGPYMTKLKCSGGRPWLGDLAEPCDHKGSSLKVLQRGASNLYFPDIRSSILIKENISYDLVGLCKSLSMDLRHYEEKEGLTQGILNAVMAGMIRKYTQQAPAPELLAKIKAVQKKAFQQQDQVPHRKFMRQLEQTLTSSHHRNPSHNEWLFRLEEYEVLQQGSETPFLQCQAEDISTYSAAIREWFAGISTVTKLTETRVLSGFRRLHPEHPPMRLSLKYKPWLPAYQVCGEGLFFQFSPQKMQALLKQPHSRLQHLMRRAHAVEKRRQPRLPASEELVIIHSLSHMLIQRLSYEAGYSNAPSKSVSTCRKSTKCWEC